MFRCIKGCGECCGIIGIPKKLAKETEHLAQVKPKKVILSKGKLYIITEDMKCVYLNRKTKECIIYSKRPRICRLYGLVPVCPCPYFDIDGRKRGLTERKIIQVRIDKTVYMALSQVQNAK